MGRPTDIDPSEFHVDTLPGTLDMYSGHGGMILVEILNKRMVILKATN